MTDVRDAALSFEGVKVAFTQNRDGYILRLAIHPADVPDALLRSFVGSRYQVVMVEVNDDETPKVPEGKRKADRLVVAAGMMCREQRFWDYLDSLGFPHPMSEDEAAAVLYDYLGIKSRKELAEDGQAREMFDGMKGEFESWLK